MSSIGVHAAPTSPLTMPPPPPTPTPATATVDGASSKAKVKAQPFWLGGVASMGAAVCTHPLDLLKVRLQCAASHHPLVAAAPGSAPQDANEESTMRTIRWNLCTVDLMLIYLVVALLPSLSSRSGAPTVVVRQGLHRLVGSIIATDGVLSLYSGLSASLLRQGTYSTVRFGCYEWLKAQRLAQRRAGASHPHDLRMSESICFSLVSGSLGGVAGNPADLVNVRMQNDRKLPVAQRRNYRNVFDGLYRIARTDGLPALWSGVGPNVARAALMTTGQLASYDVFKQALVSRGCHEKHIGTHLTASCLAGVVATVITQPVDVVKTRIMNSSPGGSPCSGVPLVAPPGGAAVANATKASTVEVVRSMLAHEGPGAFFKGFVPALTRLGPHTIATFLFLEQLKNLTS